MLRDSKRAFVKDIDIRAASDSFNKVVSFTSSTLLETVIEIMKKTLMKRDRLVSNNNVQNDNIYGLINFVEPNWWNIEMVFLPRRVAEEKLRNFSKTFHHEIRIDDLQD